MAAEFKASGKWDELSKVKEALRKEAGVKGAAERPNVIAVCYLQTWSPTAMQVVKDLDAVMKSSKLQTFICDADSDSGLLQMKIHATPALQFFYRGKALTIRRPDWADDDKFVGSLSKDNLAELFRYAGTVQNDGAKILNVDF